MVTRSQADLLFTVLPVVGLITGATAGWLARRGKRDAVSAIALWGGPLVLIGILWRVYNAITDRIGLDSVANLAVNFVLFVVVGGIVGLVWTNLAARRETQPPASVGGSIPEDGQ
jgi:hypothetical protein